VKHNVGPLKEEELEQAADWAKGTLDSKTRGNFVMRLLISITH
jgi:hypothetical protein